MTRCTGVRAATSSGSGMAVAGTIIAVILAGCTGQSPPARMEQTMTTADQGEHPALEGTLSQLAAADDLETFAEQHDIDYDDGSVRVVVELKDGTNLPSGYGLEVETRNDGRVVAWCPVGQLEPLADHENTSFVRQPAEPRTYGVE